MVSRFFPAFPAALAVALSLSASAQQVATTEPPLSHAHAEVLVLGTYHMANPGHDIFNMKADDVLASKRQAEMAELIEVLKKFHPTKIAVESDAGTEKIPNKKPLADGQWLTRLGHHLRDRDEPIFFSLIASDQSL